MNENTSVETTAPLQGVTTQPETVETVETTYINKEVDFHFRTKKVKGEPDVKRASLKLNIPHITLTGIVENLNDEEVGAKIADYLVETINQLIYGEAKIQVDANENILQETLDFDPLSLLALAKKPKSEGRGGGIAKEVWEAFNVDYIAVMVASTELGLKKVTAASGIFSRKLVDVKTNKNILEVMQKFLATWYTTSKKAEQFTPIYEVLSSKIETYLAEGEESILDKIM